MDFRTYLSKVAPSYLAFTGNDGKIDPTKSGYEGNFGSYENTDGNRAKLQGQANQYFDAYNASNNGVLGDSITTGGGSAAGSGSSSAADLAYLDDQENTLRGTLSSAQNTLNNGLTQIGDSYNKEVGRANQDQNTALQGYATNREDTMRNKTAALDKANAGSRTLSDSVRRILGMASGTNSSAFQQAAPDMIARDATQKRTGVIETSGRNLRDIDTAETTAKDRFKNYIDDLGEQRKTKESGLREGVLTQEQSINNSLGQIARDKVAAKGGGYSQMRAASAPYQAEASARQTALDGLFQQFRTPYQTQTVQADKPQLADYTVDKTALQTNDGNSASGSTYTDYLRKKFSEVAA